MTDFLFFRSKVELKEVGWSVGARESHRRDSGATAASLGRLTTAKNLVYRRTQTFSARGTLREPLLGLHPDSELAPSSAGGPQLPLSSPTGPSDKLVYLHVYIYSPAERLGLDAVQWLICTP